MRAVFVRVFTFVALPLTLVAGRPGLACAQPAVQRGLALAVEPVIPTRIEALLATPNVVIVTDYYRIDMRFGPSMRIDAVVVEAVEPRGASGAFASRSGTTRTAAGRRARAFSISKRYEALARADLDGGPGPEMDGAGRPSGHGAVLYERRGFPPRYSPVGPHSEGFPLHGIARPGGHLNRGRGARDPQAGVRSGPVDTQQQVTSRVSRGP